MCTCTVCQSNPIAKGCNSRSSQFVPARMQWPSSTFPVDTVPQLMWSFKSNHADVGWDQSWICPIDAGQPAAPAAQRAPPRRQGGLGRHHAFDMMTPQTLVCATMGGPNTADQPIDSTTVPANHQFGPAMTSAGHYTGSAITPASHPIGSATGPASHQFSSAPHPVRPEFQPATVRARPVPWPIA